MGEIVAYEDSGDLAITRQPEVVLEEAKKAAKALADVVSKKKKPVIMNGEQYLEFEDWQTVGRFYGVTAKIVETKYIDYGNAQGFEARAVTVRADGMEISAAEAMCLNDEANWSKKPLFQLRSMAQTRACAKTLRNVLAWVVVLAGYKATPAEEIQDMAQKPPITQPQAKKVETQQQIADVISEPQRKRLFAISKKAGVTDEEMKAFLVGYGFTSSKLITRDKYEEICTRAENGDISTVNIPPECTENPATCELSTWDDKQIPYCGGETLCMFRQSVEDAQDGTTKEDIHA